MLIIKAILRLVLCRYLLELVMIDHEEWILTEEILSADMHVPFVLVVHFSFLVRHVTDKVVDCLVHAELVSQSENRHFVVVLEDREERLLDVL